MHPDQGSSGYQTGGGGGCSPMGPTPPPPTPPPPPPLPYTRTQTPPPLYQGGRGGVGISDLSTTTLYGSKGRGISCGIDHTMVPPPEPGLGSFMISNTALKGVVEVGVGAALPSPSSTTPAEIVAALLLLNLRFVFGFAGGG